jgi:hypothetical protein
MDMSLKLLSEVWKNLYLHVVDGSIGVLLDGNEFENWTILQADWLFWSKTEELFVVGLREIGLFYIDVLGQSVNLLSFGFISWEEVCLALKFFGLV